MWKIRKWTFFFVVIGSNSILIYMAQQFIDFHGLPCLWPVQRATFFDEVTDELNDLRAALKRAPAPDTEARSRALALAMEKAEVMLLDDPILKHELVALQAQLGSKVIFPSLRTPQPSWPFGVAAFPAFMTQTS